MNLVFASGFLVPQHVLCVDYFRGVEAHIAAGGVHTALFPPVPPVAPAAERAQKLAEAIADKFPNGPIHILAHSMAGLDSRILIASNLHGLANPGRIASLTTLSTPHHGSPVADLLVGPRPNGLRGFVYDGLKQALALVGISIGALGDLTTSATSQIPDAAKIAPHIRYRSFFASGRTGHRPPTSFALAPTHNFILTATEQQNDGLVARDSAQYGEFQTPFWECDHADMVGYNLDLTSFRFNHLAAFDAIISQL